MKSKRERDKLILDNRKLVWYVINKFGVLPNSPDYEDIVSTGMMGLIKAANSFNSSKKCAFSTYAVTCINNEISLWFRKNKKYLNVVSIDEPIGNDGKGREITLGDMIEHPESNFIQKLSIENDFIRMFSIVLNCFKAKKRVAMLYYLGGVSQVEISEKLSVSQTYVSRIIKETSYKIRETADMNLQFQEVYSVAKVEESYRITFLLKDVKKLCVIFEMLVQKLDKSKTLPDCRVDCSKEQFAIFMYAQPESFVFVAQLFQEIDDYTKSLEGN
ncbi:MAG: sigma-70 family RNA polymerase sigma factor [Clostridia bacterium]|nr:sigma-70 family RNA polymerase sigma factor [Clostridia bacterium]